MSTAFQKRLAEDQAKREAWRTEAEAAAEQRFEVPSFKPELNRKTDAVLAARAARLGEGDASDVFTRQVMESARLESRRKAAQDKKLEDENRLFMPSINSARTVKSDDATRWGAAVLERAP